LVWRVYNVFQVYEVFQVSKPLRVLAGDLVDLGDTLSEDEEFM